jgi:hypothetical protein
MKAIMKLTATSIAVLFTVVLPIRLLATSIPSELIKSLGERINQTFVRVDDIRLLPVGSDKMDAIVIGQQRLMHESWRVQVFEVKDGHLSLKWDSNALKSIEFDETGPKAIQVVVLDGDYRLSIEGCAPHACFDGIFGFLVYSGSSGRPWTAKLTTVEGEHGTTAKYDVQWLPSNDRSAEGRDARQALERAMCQSTGLSDPAKLPFRCSADN